MKLKTIENTTFIDDQVIEDLYKFLKTTKLDKLVIRTSKVMGGWHDNEFDANAAGFNIYRFISRELEDRHEFSECYKFVRK